MKALTAKRKHKISLSPIGSCRSRRFCSTSQQTTQFSMLCLSLQQTLERKCKEVFHESGFQNPAYPKGHFLLSPHHFIVSLCPGALFHTTISIKVAQYNFSIFANQGNISHDIDNIFFISAKHLSTRPSCSNAFVDNYKSSEKFQTKHFGLVPPGRNLCMPPPKILVAFDLPTSIASHSFFSCFL